MASVLIREFTVIQVEAISTHAFNGGWTMTTKGQSSSCGSISVT